MKLAIEVIHDLRYVSIGEAVDDISGLTMSLKRKIMKRSFNNYLKSKNRTFTLSELITEYQEWLQLQGLTSPWIDMFHDVLDALPSIESAVVVTVPV